MNVNLIRDPVFLIKEGPSRRRASLKDLTQVDGVSRFDHPMAQLNPIQLALAGACLQHLAAFAGGVPLDELTEAVGAADRDVSPLVQRLFAPEVVQKASRGFDVTGDVRFMQLPVAAFGSDAMSEPPQGLFSPLRPRAGDKATGKALRAPVRRMQAVCQSCAAVGLFTHHAFTCSMAQYWGASEMRGAVVYAPVLRSVSRTLFASLLHRDHPFVKHAPHRRLPWVPDSDKTGGFNEDGTFAFESCLSPGTRMEHAANVMLPFTRGICLVVEDPSKQSVCDACGDLAAAPVTGFKLMPEPALFALCSAATKQAYLAAFEASGKGKGKADAEPADEPTEAQDNEKSKEPRGSKLLELTRSGQSHPMLAYATASKKPNALPMPQSVRSAVDDVVLTQPAWVLAENMLSSEASMPAVLKQLRLFQQDDDVDQGLLRSAVISMFGVQFEGATNPNPRGLIDERYGVDHLLDPIAAQLSVRTLGTFSEQVDHLIRAWVSAAQALSFDVELDDGPGVSRLMQKKPHRNRMKSIRQSVCQDSLLRTHATALWDEALVAMYAHMKWLNDNAATLTPQMATDKLRDRHIELCDSAASKWRHYLGARSELDSSVRDLFLEACADRQFRAELAAVHPNKAASGAKAKGRTSKSAAVQTA